MRLVRALLTTCCAIAIGTVLLVPGVRADEYNKLTYLTFSASIQVPGVTLPAGTYMFKLADPETGRRAIQIWNQDGSKLYTTLLTIPDQMMEAKSDPVVMFNETPSGSPHAVKSWFYPGDRTGMEFIYPKDQAMRIATATNSPVLSYTEDLKADSDIAVMRSTGVGRIGASGQVAANDTSATTTAQSSTTAATATTTSADVSQSTTSAQSATTVGAPARETTTATTTTAAATTTVESPAAAPVEAAPAPVANGRSDLSIDQNVPPQNERAVGTSGQAGQQARAEQGLPRTASPLAALELLSASMLAAAFGIRRLRRRVVDTQ
jgi:hypothetical protein